MSDTAEVKQDNVSEKPITPTTEWSDRQRWEAETRLVIRKEYEDLYKVWKATDLADLEKQNEKIISEGLEKYYEKFREEQKPPTDEDIQQLLDQDYQTFTVKVDYVNDDGEDKSELFTLRELPQAAEKKFYKQFKDRLLGKTQALAAFAQEGIDMPFEDKAKNVLSVLEDGFDILADTVVICLNPFGKKKEITRDWVQNNLSSNRQWGIVEAQIKINRLKDFFLRISQSGKSTQMMMTGQRFPLLQQLAR